MMKPIFLCLLISLISVNISAFTPEIKSIKLNDKEEITARFVCQIMK